MKACEQPITSLVNPCKALVVEACYALREGGSVKALKSADVKAIFDVVFEENQQVFKESTSIEAAAHSSLASIKRQKYGKEAPKAAPTHLAEDGEFSIDLEVSMPNVFEVHTPAVRARD